MRMNSDQRLIKICHTMFPTIPIDSILKMKDVDNSNIRAFQNIKKQSIRYRLFEKYMWIIRTRNCSRKEKKTLSLIRGYMFDSFVNYVDTSFPNQLSRIAMVNINVFERLPKSKKERHFIYDHLPLLPQEDDI